MKFYRTELLKNKIVTRPMWCGRTPCIIPPGLGCLCFQMTSFLALAFRGGFFLVTSLSLSLSLLFYHYVWFIITITNCNFDPTLSLSAFPYHSLLPRSTLSLQTAFSIEGWGCSIIFSFYRIAFTKGKQKGKKINIKMQILVQSFSRCTLL